MQHNPLRVNKGCQDIADTLTKVYKLPAWVQKEEESGRITCGYMRAGSRRRGSCLRAPTLTSSEAQRRGRGMRSSDIPLRYCDYKKLHCIISCDVMRPATPWLAWLSQMSLNAIS